MKPGTYDLELFTARDADALPFWSCLRGRDTSIAVIDAPETYPIRGLAGIQVGNWATHQPALSALPVGAEPPELLKDVRRVFGPRIRFAEFRPGSDIRQDLRMSRRALKRIDRKGALCRDLLSRDHFDLIVVGFSEAHTAGHRFWGYRPELQADAAVPRDNALTYAVRTVYQRIDEQFGLLLRTLPTDANVFVMSAFGMRDEYPSTGLIETFCRRLGYQVDPDPSAPSSGPLSLVRRTVPKSWRVAVSRHLPGGVQERLLADQFRTGTDWAKTIAFAIPSLYTSFVRINLRGREPQGTVEPGSEYDALLDRIEQDLRQLVDPEDGGPAVKMVTRSVEVFGGDFPITLPDLFVEWEPTARFRRRLVHPKAELVQVEPSYLRGSYHSLQGFVAAAGPSVPSGALTDDVSLLDLAPTFLSLLGAPMPDGMQGEPLESIYSQPVP